MPLPIEPTEYPDVVEERTWAVMPFSGAVSQMLWFPQRKFVVDELWTWVGDTSTGAAGVLRRVDSGEAVASGEALTGSIDLATAVDVNKIAPTLAGSFRYPLQFSETQGLGISLSGATTDGLVTVGARIRTRLSETPVARTEYPYVVKEFTWPLTGFNGAVSQMLFFPGRPFLLDAIWSWLGDVGSGFWQGRRVTAGTAITSGDNFTGSEGPLSTVNTTRVFPTLATGFELPLSFSASQGLAVAWSALSADHMLTIGARIRMKM